MSKKADEVYDILKKNWPHNIILKEHYVNYKGVRLFFDFYMKDLNILFEIQGRQHKEFVKHFHGDRAGFFEQKKRDNLKQEYVEINSIPLVMVEYNEEIDFFKLAGKMACALTEKPYL